MRIEHQDHLPQGRWGEYRHHHRRIRLLSCLAPVQYRSTLAHELGHAVYGHRRSTARTELEADAWAARYLIRPEWRHGPRRPMMTF
ncbi:ImmA/IrrE family metallo-endopeptidase [Nesterenkonia ebinurensis]|uniref:ImmA/IrrE family metallo-endopeptidase n=1 Tax=Nesterenkonia ebinurensis TaxID=2608252 RepID=UPI00123DECE3|nr:ImmA/IrrE family metallo-endopeptidase [Nesterenkonia ebinurensis]